MTRERGVDSENRRASDDASLDEDDREEAAGGRGEGGCEAPSIATTTFRVRRSPQ